MSLLRITDNFISHLNSLERMIDYLDIIKEQHSKDRDKEYSIMDTITLIIDVKSEEHKGGDLTSEDYTKNKKSLEEIMDNDLVKFIYKNITIEIGEKGEELINIKNPILDKFFIDELRSHDNLVTDITQLKNSLIISLVTSFELLISELFKDFIKNIDQSDFLKKKTINYNELLKIGDVKQARNFLLDQYIDDLLRGSFMDWMREIENKMKIKIFSTAELNTNSDLAYVNETFQRRHLLIHNNGIVNDLYLTKVEEFTVDGYKKGQRINTSIQYITERIKLFKKVGIIIIYLYSKKRYKVDLNKFFDDFNDILLDLAKEGCNGARYVYKDIFRDSNFNHGSQLMSRVNYYLSFKLNNEFDIVKNEVEDFYVETLSVEYRMAKKILLGDFDGAFLDFQNFVDDVTDEQFFHIIDWPLIKLIRKHDPVNDFIKEKMERILTIEEGDESEKLAYK